MQSRSGERGRYGRNFLLSPEAQARKQDPVYWSNLAVLDFGRLSDADRRVFLRIAPDPATLALA